jgi:cytochrome b involved in lipid metabolism
MLSLKHFFSREAFIKTVFIGITGLTIATSTVGASKVIGSITQRDQEPPEVEVLDDLSTQEQAESVTKLSNETLSDTKPASTLAPLKKLAANILPTNTPITSNSLSQQNISTGGCLVTLFGKSYDVTPLKNTHPGGDVFVCGTDMSTSYQSAHGNDVSRMAPYLVNSNGTTVANSTGTSSGSSSSSNWLKIESEHEEDDDDEDGHEELLKNEIEESKEHLDDNEVENHDD